MPSDDGPHVWRASYAILGVAGIVIATVFAVVASLTTHPADHVQPVPDLPGPVIADGNTSDELPDPTTVSTTTAIVAPTTTTKAPTSSRRLGPTSSTNQAALPQQPKGPVPAFTASCRAMSCQFDASGSSDPDGSVIYFAWSFGDDHGDQGQTKVQVRHSYDAPRTYTVTLVVMDNSGKINQTAKQVVVSR